MTLNNLGNGAPAAVIDGARAWLNEFDRALDVATAQARQNAEAVKALTPGLRSALAELGELNVGVLDEDDRTRFERERTDIREAADGALSDEDLAQLRTAINRLKALPSEYGCRIKAAEFAKATAVWHGALEQCGYAVVARTAADGTVVLLASAFPMKSAAVELRPDTDEVKLNVPDGQGGRRCIAEVQALQAALAQKGLELNMNDWGDGRPATAARLTAQTIAGGGVR